MAITITPSVGSVCQAQSPANIAVAGLVAGSVYNVVSQDPGGGFRGVRHTADGGGNVTAARTPTTGGTLSVWVYPVTEFAQTSSLPQATFPSQRYPSLAIGTAVLSTVFTFTAISGE